MNHQKLIIKDLETMAHLGLSQKEQNKLQKIRWTIEFTCSPSHSKKTVPKVCYDQITQTVMKFSKSQKFFLIESMAQDCFKLLKKTFPQIVDLKLTLHKVRPPISQLKGGVIYEYGEK